MLFVRGIDRLLMFYLLKLHSRSTMDVHFGFRDSPCGKPETPILVRTVPPVLPWVSPVSGLRTQSRASAGYDPDIEPPTVAAPHDKARHPLMGLRQLMNVSRDSAASRKEFRCVVPSAFLTVDASPILRSGG